MALLTKPNMQQIWASGGDIVEPSDLKKQQGWTVEVPPHQFENWVQNRQDEYLAHINQRGIPQWDGLTNYEAGGLSYVQGSDGIIYKSVAASGPTTTVQNPTTDVSDTYWTIAFSPNAVASETVRGLVELATNSETQTGTDTERAVTPAALSSRTATETRTGLVEIATTAEAQTGTDDIRAMTALKVKQAIEQFASSSFPFGYFSGFTLANNSGAPNTTVDVGTGSARSFDNTVDIKLASTLRGILQSSGAWAAGDNQNKLDTGARANNTWYSVFAIRKTSDGTADILFSLSATAPTMPSGYAGFIRISSIRTDASGNILGFINVGNRFVYKTPIIDMATAPITVRAPYVMKVPTGVRVLAQIGIQGAGGDFLYWITETDGGAIPSSMYYGVLTSIGDDRGGQAHYVMTNTSGQVLLETGVSVTTFNVSALGWTEIRG